MLKLYVSIQLLIKRTGVSFLLTNAQAQIKLFFLNEIHITFNKIFAKYDNVLLAGDLNIEELKPISDSSSHLSDAKNVFNLQNLFKKPTCFKSQD